MPSSYIDTNDEVKFHMQLVYNITMGATLSATLTVSSSLLKVIDCNAKGWPVYLHFDGIMIKSSIEAGSTYNANFTTRIKENVQPYSRLIVDIEAVFFYTGFDYETKFYKSTPIVRAAVPSIKFGELIGNNVSVNAQFVMTIEIILPLLPAFTLRSEITTDIEDYVFMSIDNVTVSFIGSGIKLNGSQVVKNSSIQGYGNIDIVKGATIDFGNVQVRKKFQTLLFKPCNYTLN
ncbi:uncharacterized protein LOC130636841 [Hydractinia symbiolongicarpus]|uniref:uncharacterized protein LOC130636839 n=1 Tax=Hydractinia symbiolongicarpus TaxID=13093 RepID=UPI00254A488C|nr:uncharacterized protein LOC130636839 [Hydractinia symbiolongicarpus]XP_057302673.1 uncharacterized protein LOC130636841 [Hydractinia symbiolongicarpus]